MNDEFLHRARRAPPPQFLKGLKARLDRQLPLAPAPRRRWTFTRGLLAGLLLGGVAFAFLARLLPGLQHTPAQVHETHAVPLGPVWLPDHPARPGPPEVPTDSVDFIRQGDGTSPAQAGAGAAKSSAPGVGPSFEQVTVVAASTAFFVATSAANGIARGGFGRTRIEINTARPFDRLCNNDPAPADVVELPRRITRVEFQRCLNTRAFGIVEVKIGYQAVVLARAQLYGPLRFSARDLFLALARRIPDPSRPQSLINNPYTTWNQLDPALPYDRIQVIGPALDTPPGKLAGALLLEPGCNTFEWLAALHDSDPEQYEQICGSLREDSAYRAASSAGWAYLATNPTALGIFSLNEYGMSRDGLVLIPIDGIAPTLESIYAGTYPLERSLYLYTSSVRSLGNQVFMSFIRNNMAAKNLYSNDPNGWGFVQLEKSEIDANLAIAQERRELRF